MSDTHEGTVVRLPLRDPRWTTFVSSHPEASVAHLPEWSHFLADCYGFDAFVLAELVGNEVVWGLPTMEVGTPLRARRWVSLPFSDECGPLGMPSAASLGALEGMRASSSASSHEIRAALPIGRRQARGFTHTLDLHAGPDELMRGYRSSIRQGIRVADREGVVVRMAERKSDLTETFYALHVATRRRLGVPVQTRRFFSLLWDNLIDSSRGFVLVAERDGLPLAAGVFLRAGRTVLYKFGASDAEHWKLRANAALFHQAIVRAAERGATVFDWGRTDAEDEGLRRFKSNWGSDEQELVYTTLGDAPGDEGSGPSRTHRLARIVIQKSPPALCRAAGALLYRYAA